MKEHFEEFKNLLAADKKKFEDEKKKNRKQLLELQKKQQELLNVEDDIFAQQLEQGRFELMELLNLLKKRIQIRKSEIDAVLLKDLHDTRTVEFENTASNKKKTTSVLNSLKIQEKNSGGMDSSRIKRSLFNAKPFGAYHSYSQDLKPWTAADLLTLKRDAIFAGESVVPPNDDDIFKNIVEKVRINQRKKKSIDNYDNTLNEIDGEFKDSIDKYVSGEMQVSTPQYEKIERPILLDNEIKKEGRPIVDHKNRNKNNVKNETKVKHSKSESHVQKISTDEDTKTFGQLISNITGFLSKLGNQLGNYIRKIAYD